MTLANRFDAKFFLQYNGYPQRAADRVVRENITDEEDWEESLLLTLADEGIVCRGAKVESAYQPNTDDDFVCLRVVISLECYGDEQLSLEKLNRFCQREVELASTFYCDSCWVEEGVE